MSEPTPRPNAELVHAFPVEEPIVGLLEFKDRLFVATSRRLYMLHEGKLHPVPVQHADD